MKNKKTAKINSQQLEERLLRSQKRIIGANQRLKNLDKEKSEFIAVASHRLRNPLACIRWSVEMLLSPETSRNFTAEQNNFLQEISKNNHILIELVDNLLRVCKIEEGKTEIKPKFIHLGDLFRQTIRKLSDKIKNKGVKVMFPKDLEDIHKVCADPEKIRRVLLNILDNAIVYNYAGGIISITLENIVKKYGGRDKNYVKCSVFNTGVGIPKNYLKGMFSKFFRAENVITVHTEGNGLDLFVAKSYIESHGGKIWAESEGEGKGVTVSFILPAGKASDCAV